MALACRHSSSQFPRTPRTFPASQANMFPRLASVALLALLASSPSRSADDANDPPWKIHIELQAITLPAKDAFALLPELSDEKSMPAAWTKLEAMITGGKAKVSAVLRGQTHGAKIEAHQGEDLRYPSQFEQPFPIGNPAGEKADPKQNLGVAFGPTVFEVRATGVMLTADAYASADGKRITVTATPEHVWMLGWQEFEQGRLANNEKIIIKQPRFASAKTTGTFALQSGERTLLSIHRVPDHEKEMELFILRAWTTPHDAGKK